MLSLPGISPGPSRRIWIPPTPRIEAAGAAMASLGPIAASRSTGGAAWAPSDLANLVAWLRADMGITLGGTLYATGTTPPAVTITGSLSLAIGFRVEITPTGGSRGTATFRYSADNGSTWIESNVLTAATYACIGAASGITLNFTVGTYATDNVYRGVIATWADQSGAGNDFEQATASNQPNYVLSDSDLSSEPAVFFDRANNRLGCANSITMGWVGVVAVYPAATFSDFSTLIAKGTGASGDFAFRGESASANWRTSDGIAGTRYRNGSATNVALTSANVAHNYELVPSSPSTASTWVIGHNPGADRRWSDSVAEIVICSADPSAGEKTDWRSYCSTRYGTP